MQPVVLACSDLMTASRIEASGGDAIATARSEASVRDLLDDRPTAALVVDLQSFPTIAEQARTWGFAGPIIGFAPHVRVDLLDEARDVCDAVVARGAVVKSLARVLDGCTIEGH